MCCQRLNHFRTFRDYIFNYHHLARYFYFHLIFVASTCKTHNISIQSFGIMFVDFQFMFLLHKKPFLFSLSLSLSLSLCVCVCVSLSLSHTHTHTNTLSLSLSLSLLSLSHTLSLSLFFQRIQVFSAHLYKLKLLLTVNEL